MFIFYQAVSHKRDIWTFGIFIHDTCIAISVTAITSNSILKRSSKHVFLYPSCTALLVSRVGLVLGRFFTSSQFPHSSRDNLRLTGEVCEFGSLSTVKCSTECYCVDLIFYCLIYTILFTVYKV